MPVVGMPLTLTLVFGVSVSVSPPRGLIRALPAKTVKKHCWTTVSQSALIVVPRTAATAFGVRICNSSPGRKSCLATLTRIAPDESSCTDRVPPAGRGSSRTSRRLSSLTVTVLLPPKRIRTNDLSAVSTTSRITRPSLKRSSTGVGTVGRVKRAVPCRAVTTPTGP
jgi:hypothetical protein